MAKKWIQEAIKEPGALRRQLKTKGEKEMRKAIIFAFVVLGLGGGALSIFAGGNQSDPGVFNQDVIFGRYLWSLDLEDSLKHAGTLRDTIYVDTLVTDSVNVGLFINPPHLITIADTTGLAGTVDSIFIEARKRYWRKGTWTSYAGFDTIFPTEQTGSVMVTKVLWSSSDIHPFQMQFLYIGKDTSRIVKAKIVGQ
jgi:hypothetical protein